MGGSGVDGGIHRSAEPKLLEACRALGGCKTGGVKLTKGHNLNCQYIIYTVGPIWHGGGEGEAALLQSCYENSLKIAQHNECCSIAFPAICTGIFGYPKEATAKIAYTIFLFASTKRPILFMNIYKGRILKKVSFYVTGNVQGAMFRQTIIRGAQKRKIKGGATNDSKNHHLVHCSLEGEESVVEEMINKLREKKPLNSWNAQVIELHFYDHFIEFSNHQITTDNVNDYNWSPDVDFYL